MTIDDVLFATATVTNRMDAVAPMVIVDLPIPAGFALEPDGLEEAADAGSIAKYQVTPRSAIVYLRSLEPGKPLVLRYGLRASMPVKLTTSPARVYEYYDPDKQAVSAVQKLVVTPK